MQNYFMIEIIESYQHYSDPRGKITGIINSGEWREINIIESQADAVRGGHYHCKTRELFYIIEGDIDVVSQRVESGRAVGEPETVAVSGGSIFIVSPMTLHTFHVKTDARWINALSQPLNENSPDMHRL